MLFVIRAVTISVCKNKNDDYLIYEYGLPYFYEYGVHW